MTKPSPSTLYRARKRVACPVHDAPAGTPCPDGGACPARVRAYRDASPHGGARDVPASIVPVGVPREVAERYRAATDEQRENAREAGALAIERALPPAKPRPARRSRKST